MSSASLTVAGRNQETLGEEVFQAVLELILSCELEPGMVVNEAVLALRFGVSRGPVREAIRRLQGIQLVTREPFMRARVVSLSERAIIELFEVRQALEGFACQLAAQTMSDENIDAVVRELEASQKAEDPGQHFDFHERIVRGCGNQRIVDSLCGDLYHLLRIYRRMSGAVQDRKAQAYTEHWQIMRAVRARDGALAESLMRAHVARAGQNIVAQMRENLVPTRKGLQNDR